MPACPSAPCFSPEATGSVPLLRDLLSDADVTRLHTLRPAPPVPGLYAALCRRVPWPDVSRALPCNALPDLPGTTAQAPFASLPDLPAGSLEGLRLGYVLFSLPWPDAVSLCPGGTAALAGGLHPGRTQPGPACGPAATPPARFPALGACDARPYLAAAWRAGRVPA